MPIVLGFLSRYWLHLLVAGAVIYSYKLTLDYGVSMERERWEKQAYQATIQYNAAASKFTAGLITGNQEIQDNGDKKIEQLESDLANADRIASSLRQQALSYAANARRCASDSARANEGRKSAEEAAGVLANMFNRADERAGKLAEYADRLEIAHSACIDSYNKLRDSILNF